MHQWAKLKDEAKKAEWYKAPTKGKVATKEEGGNDADTDQPAAASARKRAGAKTDRAGPAKRGKRADDETEVKPEPEGEE